MKKTRSLFSITLLILTIIGGLAFVLHPQMNATAHKMEAENHLRNITANEASALLAKDKTITVLDIRTPEEFAQGHIDGAINIDYYAPDFATKIAALSPDETYLVHCRSGGRSSAALPTLQKAGLKHVLHMNDGFMAWSKK